MMSRDGYLPPGVEHSDIPGNRPEDEEWDSLYDWLVETGLDATEIRRRVTAPQPGEPVADLMVSEEIWRDGKWGEPKVRGKRVEASVRAECRQRLEEMPVGLHKLYLAPPEREHKFEPWMVEWVSRRAEELGRCQWPSSAEKGEQIAAAIQDILRGPEDE